LFSTGNEVDLLGDTIVIVVGERLYVLPLDSITVVAVAPLSLNSSFLNTLDDGSCCCLSRSRCIARFRTDGDKLPRSGEATAVEVAVAGIDTARDTGGGFEGGSLVVCLASCSRRRR
jgi:hypothetical protein